MSNSSISPEALHKLLVHLFPDTEISRPAVYLLALQIAKLETENAFAEYGINDHFIYDADFQSLQDHRPFSTDQSGLKLSTFGFDA